MYIELLYIVTDAHISPYVWVGPMHKLFSARKKFKPKNLFNPINILKDSTETDFMLHYGKKQ